MLSSQRGRLMHAALVATAKKGTANLVVADVTTGSGVSSRTFYEQFEGLDDCFAQAYATANEVLMAAIATSAAGEPDGEPRIHAGVKTYVEVIAGEPLVGAACLIHAAAFSPELAEASAGTLGEFAAMIAGTWQRATGTRTSAAARRRARLAVGVAETIARDRLARGEASHLRSDVPAIVSAMLAILAGK